MEEKKEEVKLNSDEVKNRGEAVEIMLGTDGWKYLKEWMEEQARISLEMIAHSATKLKTMDDLYFTRDFGQQRLVYKAVLGRPKEWINEKNKVINKEIKKEAK